MQTSHWFPRFAAGTLACVMSLAAHAQRATPEQLTAYRIVSGSGLCATVDTQLVNAYYFPVYAAACSDTNMRQLFYILALGSDTDFVWQTQPPGTPAPARIVLADRFDRPTNPAYYNLDEHGYFLALNMSHPATTMQYRIKQVPKVATWTPVASSGQYFGVAGWRTLQYRAPDGQALYRSAQGIDTNGYGQCTDAFFGGTLPGATKSCLVQGADRRDTPVQVQLFPVSYTVGDVCLGYYVADNPSLQITTYRDCNPSSGTGFQSVWSLVPAKYPQ